MHLHKPRVLPLEGESSRTEGGSSSVFWDEALCFKTLSVALGWNFIPTELNKAELFFFFLSSLVRNECEVAEPLSPLNLLVRYVNVQRAPTVSFQTSTRFQNISVFGTVLSFTAPICNLCYKTPRPKVLRSMSIHYLFWWKYSKNLIWLIQDDACVLHCLPVTTLRIKINIGCHWSIYAWLV